MELVDDVLLLCLPQHLYFVLLRCVQKEKLDLLGVQSSCVQVFNRIHGVIYAAREARHHHAELPPALLRQDPDLVDLGLRLRLLLLGWGPPLHRVALGEELLQPVGVDQRALLVDGIPDCILGIVQAEGIPEQLLHLHAGLDLRLARLHGRRQRLGLCRHCRRLAFASSLGPWRRRLWRTLLRRWRRALPWWRRTRSFLRHCALALRRRACLRLDVGSPVSKYRSLADTTPVAQRSQRLAPRSDSKERTTLTGSVPSGHGASFCREV
mmetsp:Transcript_123069/g.359297  ORF Transcript_123069/g.359297 Transcript_123069/m.359297 type:complete len:267 (-) Transcript_123069:763-1563(-)